ncbi:trace amine-associated receptor 1-like [Orbicella faveolata]|uniref:trace amine-associated receptor 1-like n=1 Tax=Orbicella faveolata TaxID=48498 RepID=UPI0009E1F82D|nr:trace amine-associated receptor 1-like [Orbicella faveolata]
MAAISVDRFIAVVYPLRYKSIIDSYGLKILLTTSWALPITVPILISVIPTNFPQAKAFIGLGIFGTSYVIVFLFYSLIVISLVKRRIGRKQLRMHSSNDTSQPSVEIRVAFTLAIVIAVFTVCWAPLVTALFATGKPLVKIQGVAHMWIGTLALSNSAMNFVIYGSRMRNFHEAYAVCGRKLLEVFRPKYSCEDTNL